MLLPGARSNLLGLLIGKFPDTYNLNTLEVEASFKSRDYLKDIPIAYNFPRGYAQPSLYLPIGEKLSVELKKSNTIRPDAAGVPT